MGENTFKCPNGVFVSVRLLCDGNSDCPGQIALDESGCICTFSLNLSTTCKHTIDQQNKQGCSPFYKTLQRSTCVQYGHDTNELISTDSNNHQQKEAVQCNNSNESARVVLNDLVSDCGPNLEDEPLLRAVLELNFEFPCPTEGHLPCKMGHPKCYSVAEICSFKLNQLNHLLPCRTGGHLANCHKFICNQMYKCDRFYCVPWSYICDGKWDCPSGQDEFKLGFCSLEMRCVYMFRCKASFVCVHIAQTCDGIVDCPLHDDENLCEFSKSTCPNSCQCLTYVVRCVHTVFENYLDNSVPYKIVQIHESNLHRNHSCALDSPLVFPFDLSDVITLCVSACKVQTICQITSELRHLQSVDFSMNIIKVVKKNCFQYASHLKDIHLNHNNIISIEEQAFSQLFQLMYLDISNNLLTSVSQTDFADTLYLTYLSIFNNRLTNMRKVAFDTLPIKLLITKNYRICCLAPSFTVCTAKIPWYESCRNLLPSIEVEISFHVVSALIMILNICALALHARRLKGNKEVRLFEATVVAINMSDLLCYLYLVDLIMADQYYKMSGQLLLLTWRNSFPCHLAFSVIFSFTLVSPALLSLFSVSRLMVTLYPLKSRFKNTEFLLSWLSCLLCCSLVSISVVWSFLFQQDFKVPTNLCSPFVDATNTYVLIKTLTIVSSFLQGLGLICIVLTNISLTAALHKHVSQHLSVLISHRKYMKISVVVQILAVTLSNVMCWVPANTIFLLSLFTNTFSTDLIVWTTVVVVPINSIINPCIFLICSVRRIVKEREDLWSRFIQK